MKVSCIGPPELDPPAWSWQANPGRAVASGTVGSGVGAAVVEVEGTVATSTTSRLGDARLETRRHWLDESPMP